MKLTDLTIKECHEGLTQKKFSPAELVSACLEIIEKKNSHLNSFLSINKEALRRAEAITLTDLKESWLAGIPLAIKDNFATKGLRTTAGSKVLADFIPPYEATVIERLQKEKAIIIGKTNMDAWAHGSSGENSDFGLTRNPWNPDYVPGGSSSGSAASVASGMAIAATGTDTGGSIRLPASFCNLVGLKPTYGLVSRYGVIAMASSLDVVGFLTKSVEDAAILLEATAGRDGFDATLADRQPENYLKNINAGIKNFRIGLPKEYLSAGIEKGIKDVFDSALRVFEKLGAEIIEVSLPHTPYALAVYYVIQPCEVSSNLARFDGIRYGFDRSFFADEAKRRIMLGTFSLSSGYYEAYYLKAMKVRRLIGEDFNNAFKKVDLLLTPTSPQLPFKIGEKVNDPLKMYLSDILTVTANLAGVPAISFPAGFFQGLPVGLQLIGPQFGEKNLFRAAGAFEEETGWQKKRSSV